MFRRFLQKSNTLVLFFGLCLWLFGVTLFLPNNVSAQQTDGYEVKAKYILNFAKATQWPDEVFTDSSENIDLCLVGRRSFVEAFEPIDGQQVGVRTLRVRIIPVTDDCAECEILFVSNDVHRTDLFRLLSAVEKRPVLVIGERPGFAKVGGIINFVSREERLFFEINLQEAMGNGILLNSHILRLATIIERD